jgi:hypothetical protein
MAFVAGDLLIVLPGLIDASKDLLERRQNTEWRRRGQQGDELRAGPDVIVPVSFNFPHATKLLSLSFIPFAAWFADATLPLRDYPQLFGAGLADGETDPAALATLATARLRATPEQLCDAFQVCPALHPVYRRLLKLTLEELRVIEDHLGQLDPQMADLLAAHRDAVQRLAEVPGLGVDSAQQIIAEVGATAATFPSSKHLASWMGACPGNEESAGVNYSHRCPKGNRQMRRVLNQAANAAVKAKGTIFNVVYRRLVPRLGHAQAIGAITHRLCRLIWKILPQQIRYEERGLAVSTEAKKVRARKMIRELRSLGYHVELLTPPAIQLESRSFLTLAHPLGSVNRPVFEDQRSWVRTVAVSGSSSPGFRPTPARGCESRRGSLVRPRPGFPKLSLDSSG